jgi:2-phospho-L-lactate guanylyltransferase
VSSCNSLAIVPVRSLTTGKTRLAPTITPEMRRELTKRMLAITLAACRASDVIDQILVISPDIEALAFAHSLDSEVIGVRQCPETPGLIPALNQARAVSLVNRFETMIVLFADLPLVNGEDVAHFAAIDGQIVIAPDQNRIGTNGLLLRKGPAETSGFAFQFGADSFRAHLAESRRIGIEPAIAQLPGLSFDLDTPDDLSHLITIDLGLLERLGRVT